MHLFHKNDLFAISVLLWKILYNGSETDFKKVSIKVLGVKFKISAHKSHKYQFEHLEKWDVLPEILKFKLFGKMLFHGISEQNQLLYY